MEDFFECSHEDTTGFNVEDVVVLNVQQHLMVLVLHMC